MLWTGFLHLLAVGKDPCCYKLSRCKVLYSVQILVPDSFVAIFYFLDNIAKSPANEIDSFADALAPSGFETVLDISQVLR